MHACVRIGLLFVFFAASLVAQTSWTASRIGLPGVNLAQSVAFGNGRFVVTLQGGGNSPGVAWSTDGLTWRAATASLAQQGTVLFTQGAFYHAGHIGVWRSTDGDSWHQIYSPTTRAFLRGMAATGRSVMIVAPNTDGKFVLYTDDFSTWQRAAPLPGSETGAQVLYGDLVAAFGRYYLGYTLLGSAGGLPSFTPRVAWTTDGSTWTPAEPPIASARNLAAGNGRLLAYVLGSSTTPGSTDATTFTNPTLPPSVTGGGSLLFAGGRFFFSDTLQSSIDGQRWAPLATYSSPSVPTVLLSMAYGNGRYVAVGYSSDADVVMTLPAPAPPVISTPPADRTVSEGTPVTFSVTLENGDDATTYQWRRNGTPVAGATAATLTFPNAHSADAGAYTVEIRNTLGAVTTDAAQLTVLPVSALGRIINLSVLTSLDAATGPDATFTVGFVTGGSGTEGHTSLLVRAGGPALARFGVASPLADPRLELFSGSEKLVENDNWGGSPALADIARRVGAFAFATSDSKDAAVFSDTIARGDNSVKISGAAGATGDVIAEVYDATAASAYTATTPRLINVSVMKSLRPAGSLSAGFVIGGTTPRSVVIRVIGPSLSTFGVATPLSDPRMSVFRGAAAAPFTTNDNWGGAPELANAFSAVGAFALPANSRDAALLLTLEPGDYIVQASNSGTTSGTALIEIYEAP